MKKRKLSESEKAEARSMLVKFYGDEGGFSLVFNDGYYAKSIVDKFGMSLEEVKEASGYNQKKAERSKLLRNFSWY